MDGWKQLEEKASAFRVDDVAGRLMDAIHAVQQAATSDLSELRGMCNAKADAAEFEQLKYGMVRPCISLVRPAVYLCPLTQRSSCRVGCRQHDLLAVGESMQSEMSSVRASLQSREVPQPTTSRREEAPSGDNSALTSELQSVASQLDAVKRQLRSELYQARYVRRPVLLLVRSDANDSH